MLRTLRLLYLTAAVLLLLVLPVGQAGIVLVLFVAVDLGAAALLLRPEAARPTSVLVFAGDFEYLGLMRRTVPALRSRHPTGTVEAQVRWREAAQARRQSRDRPEASRYSPW